MTAQEVKTFANSGQYTQGQYIHFQQSQAFNIVFIPLNYGALGHAGIFDRNQFIKRPRRNYKASDVLGKMARKAPYFINQLNKLHALRGVGVKPQSFYLGFPASVSIAAINIANKKVQPRGIDPQDRKSTRLNSSHV